MKVKLIKSLYFLHGINEKVVDSLQMQAVEKRYRFGDTVFDWNTRIQGFYIVQEGEVKLLKKTPQDESSEDAVQAGISGVHDDKRILQKIPVIAKSLLHSNKYVEFGMRTEKQPFGEEYFYLKHPTEYKVVVSSEKLVSLEIPFKILESTLHTFPFFNPIIKEFMMTHLKQNLDWRESVEKGFQKVKVTLPTVSEKASALFKLKMDKLMGREIPPSTRAANVLIK